MEFEEKYSMVADDKKILLSYGDFAICEAIHLLIAELEEHRKTRRKE